MLVCKNILLCENENFATHNACNEKRALFLPSFNHLHNNNLNFKKKSQHTFEHLNEVRFRSDKLKNFLRRSTLNIQQIVGMSIKDFDSTRN